MITLEPPRGLPPDADAWSAFDLPRAGLSRFLRSARTAVGMIGDVDVLLTDDRTLRRLNRQFRGKDKATDVLSFPTAEFLSAEHAGDLAVSLETAQRQATEHGHSLQQEVKVLLLHGLLHLHGMDHETDGGEMAAREAALRARLRLPAGLIARTGQTGGEKAKALNAKGAKGKREGRHRDGATSLGNGSSRLSQSAAGSVAKTKTRPPSMVSA